MNNVKSATGGNLFPLRKNLTLEEASIYLSESIRSEISEDGVLQLALEGTLTLSVNLLNLTYGLEILDCELTPEEKDSTTYYPFNSAKKRLREILNKKVSFASKIDRFKGVWDIVLTDLTKILIQNRINELSGNPQISYTAAPDCVCLEDSTGKIIALTQPFENIKIKPITNESSSDIPENHRVKTELPENSNLVVRKKALDDLILKSDEEASQNAKLDMENAIPPYLDPNHPRFAKELYVAVKAWTELYHEKDADYKPQGGHIKHIIKWIKKEFPKEQNSELGGNALTRIATVINPGKAGGASLSNNNY